MFGGLIESVGQVDGVEEIPEGIRLTLGTVLAPELELGESVAVNGVCLTVVDRRADAFVAEVSPETARVTTLGRVSPGAVVNLERSLRVDARLGGHFVLGHVDGIGHVQDVRPQSDFHLITIGYEADLAPYLVEKGSIAVDGTSLTIATLRSETFDVQIVPYTWQHTILHKVAAKTAVNLECDIIGKYVVRAVRQTA
jgi:riboflavin synthase